MIVQAEVSLYPLGACSLGDRIEAFIDELEGRGIEVEKGAMSSLLRGETRDIFTALGEALEKDFEAGGSVLNIKVSNACPR